MKAAAAKRYRRLVCEAIEAEHLETKPWFKVSVKAEFYHATKRMRDQDNAMGALKAAYDGIVDSGLVLNDDYEHMLRESPSFATDKEHPRVVLTITHL